MKKSLVHIVALAALAFASPALAQRLSPQGGNVVGVDATPGSGIVITGTPARPAVGTNPAVLQVRLVGECAPGSAIRKANGDGTVVCELDDDTTYTAGSGIAITGTAVAIDPAYVQRRVGSCPGSAISTIAQDGTAGCISAGGITNSATANTIMKSNGTNAVASSWTDDGTTSTTTGRIKISGLATTVKDFEVVKSAATAWHLTTRDTPNTYPAAVMRASQADTVLAFDLFPNGTPAIGAGGYTWFDSCDADLWANNALPVHCARVGIDGHASFGSVAFNGATERNIRMHIGGVSKLDIGATGSSLYTTLSIAPSSGSAVIDGFVNQNTGTWFKLSNTHSGTGAYSKYELANDSGTGVVDLFAFGTGYTTNGGLMQDSGVLYAGAGMSNGLNLIAGAAGSSLRFYTGGFAATNNWWTMNSSGHLVSKAGPLVFSGTGTPEAVVTAPVGSLYMRSDGGAGTSLYVKESGSGNTGWAAK